MRAERFWRVMLVWVMLVATLWTGERFIRSVWLTFDEPRPITPRASLAEAERTTIDLFNATAPSVVYIVTNRALPAHDPTGRGMRGAGSGFVWDGAGHIVTNHHVVEGAERVSVRFDTGETVPARVVGVAANYDLAVLRLSENRAHLRPIPLGRSADLQVGQAVFAIGNPFGLNRSLSTGVISALDRRLPVAGGREIVGVIQTDAAINPGNSGGPLLDSAGRLIGVNTAILSGSGTFSGIGFAVPVDTVNKAVPVLVRSGRMPMAGIGIVVAPEELVAQVGAKGVLVADVVRGSAAERAGLRGTNIPGGRLGDIIIEVNGRPVATLAELANELERIGIGRDAVLTVLRDGRPITIEVRVIDIS